MSLRDRLRARLPRVMTPGEFRAAADRAVVSGLDGLVSLSTRASETRTKMRRAWRAAESVGQSGGGHADEDQGWRKVSANERRTDLSAAGRDRLMRLAPAYYLGSPTIKSGIDIITAYTVGDGFTVAAPDPDVQAVIDRHWHHRVNDWPLKQSLRVRQLSLYGSLVLLRRRTQDGTTVLRRIAPEKIDQLVCDPADPGLVIGVRLKRDPAGAHDVIRTILSRDEVEALSGRARDLRERMLKNGKPVECFLANINQIEEGDLGVGDATAAYDFAEVMDVLYELFFAKFEAQHNVVWDIAIENLTPEEYVELKKGRLRNSPGPNSVNVHSDREKWNAIAPESRAADNEALINLYLAHVARALKLPPNWLANPGDVNFAAAVVSKAPVIRFLKERQGYVSRFIDTIVYDTLEAAVAAGKLDSAVLDDRAAYTVSHSAIVDDAGDAQSGALNAITMSLSSATQNGWLSYETAVRAFAALAKRTLNVEIDPQAEIDAVLGFSGARAGAAPAAALGPGGEDGEGDASRGTGEIVAPPALSAAAEGVARNGVVRMYGRRGKRGVPPALVS